MSVGQVQQVPQSAASPVPALVADAVLQNHVVRPHGLHDVIDFLRGAPRVHLIDLLAHAHTHREEICLGLLFSILKILLRYNLTPISLKGEHTSLMDLNYQTHLYSE